MEDVAALQLHDLITIKLQIDCTVDCPTKYAGITYGTVNKAEVQSHNITQFPHFILLDKDGGIVHSGKHLKGALIQHVLSTPSRSTHVVDSEATNCWAFKACPCN